MRAHAPSRALTVLIIDDDVHFRSLARRLLERDGLVVVGEAGDSAAGLAAQRELRADVVLVHVRLPDRPGLEICREIVSDQRAAAAVVVTASVARDDLRQTALAAGAADFIEKDRLTAWTLEALVYGRSL